MCIQNAKDCGQQGKTCCITTTPSSTSYWCNANLYCPFGASGSEQEPCKRCPPPDKAEADGIWECGQYILDQKASGNWFT